MKEFDFYIGWLNFIIAPRFFQKEMSSHFQLDSLCEHDNLTEDACCMLVFTDSFMDRRGVESIR